MRITRPRERRIQDVARAITRWNYSGPAHPPLQSRLCWRAILSAVTSHALPGLALLFDLDGVLVDSMPMHTEAWQLYLERLGIEQPYLAERMHGKRNSELVSELIGRDLTPDVVFEHGAAKERLFRELILAADLARFRVSGLEEFLAQYEGVPMAVASNAEPANIDFVLDELHLRKYFPVTVNGSEVRRPKPFPDVYLKAAERLGIKPANCIVFEDSPTGVAAGVAAGMRVVGVETTPTVFEGIAYKIHDFRDPGLPAWLEAAAAASRAHSEP
jgi:beta-phosphoglucomutase